MHRPSGTAAVRLMLGTLIFAALAMSLFQPASAGTPEAPEIQDGVEDQAIAGEGPEHPACPPQAGCLGSRIDVISVWIDEDAGDTINVNILLSNVPGGATTASAEWNFHATYGGTEVVASAVATGGQQALQPPVAGANVQAVAVDGNTLILTVLKSVYGTVVPGTPLTGLFVDAESTVPTVPVPVPIASDRAPNEGAGLDYTFPGGTSGGPCPNCTADDTDGDGLNDTWEQQYFGDLNETAEGDPDGDGLTNGQEQALGTDPTNPDTDGDGTNDKDDPFPLDPTQGGTTTTSTSSSSTSSTSSSTSSTSASTSTTGDSAGGPGDSDDDGEVKTFADAMERLESDVGYLGMSAGGFLAVLVLCIIALATRWSL